MKFQELKREAENMVNWRALFGQSNGPVVILNSSKPTVVVYVDYIVIRPQSDFSLSLYLGHLTFSWNPKCPT
jgi:hypothetical protein